MAPTTAAHLNEEKVLTILHFNDVYNIESGTQEPVGGAARFLTALKSYAHLEPMILFSGDIFAPSFSKNFIFDIISLCNTTSQFILPPKCFIQYNTFLKLVAQLRGIFWSF